MTHNIYTLWASLPGESAPWMIAAEDEYSWEGDPDRCEAAFKKAREESERNGFEVREVTLTVPYGDVAAAFDAVKVGAGVQPPPAHGGGE